VIALVRWSDAESGTVTQLLLLEASKLSAPPYFPAAQAAPVIVPVLPFPERSVTAVPAPSSNAYAATRPETAADPPARADASRLATPTRAAAAARRRFGPAA